MVPPELPDTEPYGFGNGKNADWESKDNPGGYMRRWMTCDPYSDDRASYKIDGGIAPEYLATKPVGFFECRGFELINLKYNTGKFIQTENCTAKQGDKPVITGAKYWSGKVNSQTVCDADTCCKKYWGIQLNDAANAENVDKEITKMMVQAGCPKPDEELYCKYQIVMHSCLENYLKTGKTNNRLVIQPCHDTMYRYYLSCKLFGKAGVKLINTMSVLYSLMEPEHYYDTLSPQQNMMIIPAFNSADKVCHPYSYYNPDEVKSAAFVALPLLSYSLACLAMLQ